MKENKIKPYIKIPFLTPPNIRHRSVKDYNRHQNKQAVEEEIRDSIAMMSDIGELANYEHWFND